MSVDLSSLAEQNAKRAEQLPAFDGINLLSIKRQVAAMLGQIGRNAIFDQYTKHDITHIDEMLRNLQWLVPNSSKQVMSEADWLMIVLAVYFHDMGMLVTKSEFNARESSGFPAFCEQVLFSGPEGEDYRFRVNSMNEEDRDRFLYQEFIRHHHPERIRAWIMGQTKDQLGLANAAVTEVSRLLEPLGPQFRRDLGIVCESHHLSDLDDVNKYKVSQPYGNSENETVNLQYCAVLLRSADLLHITSDRTPSIEFRIINPTDPISQQEWAKQEAVTRVRPKPGVNEEGQVDDLAPQDTIEVFAYFSKVDGFFGLTSYLAYAADQIRRSNEWISNSVKLRLAKHEFPWRRIDDSNIETEGFIRDTFEFTLDQAKILDLLTGHTLYNDTNVVLRELVQNAIDAIRIKHFPNSPVELGLVTITYNEGTRMLSVMDNGTGMTQGMINDFLLKVGSSRYQDPEFKKNYPEFSSISRFGIGVLSAFMIADSVEIVTCHPDEDQARQLTLRSVHGKYLIRLLEKSEADPKEIGPHGTIFRLRVRPTVDMRNVLKAARYWIVIPDCTVIVQIDNGVPEPVGYSSPAEALRSFLVSTGISFTEESEVQPDFRGRRIRIVERSHDEITLAYALQWDPWFKEWSFLIPEQFARNPRSESRSYLDTMLLGTCVEGIRVVPDTPGFDGYPIAAIANVRGQSAPKTNVARSGLEVTPERDAMLREVYGLYVQHVITELAELSSHRAFSPTWATSETEYLIKPLSVDSTNNVRPLSSEILQEMLDSIPCVMVDENGLRHIRSPRDLAKAKEFWTIDCALLTSADSLIREVVSSASLSDLFDALGISDFHFPAGPVVSSRRHVSSLLANVFSHKEVDQIIVNEEQRRIDLRWVDRSTPARWLRAIRSFHGRELQQFDVLSASRDSLLVPGAHVTAEVPTGVVAVRSFGTLYLTPNSDVADFARSILEMAMEVGTREEWVFAEMILAVISEKISQGIRFSDLEALRKYLRFVGSRGSLLDDDSQIDKVMNLPGFAAIMLAPDWRLFDTSAWKRKGD